MNDKTKNKGKKKDTHKEKSNGMGVMKKNPRRLRKDTTCI